jgi:hypothetical protein
MTEIEATREMTRSELADYLREFAAQLDGIDPIHRPDARPDEGTDRRVTFTVGSDSPTVDEGSRVREAAVPAAGGGPTGPDADRTIWAWRPEPI